MLAHTLLLGQGMPPGAWVGLLGLLFILCFLWLVAARYRKVGPNRVLIVYGLRTRGMRDEQNRRLGFRVVKGGGTIVLPVVERCETLSLELMTIDVNIKKIYTITGVPINVDGVAQIKVKGDDISIRTAAERFLSMGLHQVMEIARQTLEGHLRAIVGTLTVEEIYKDRDAFAAKVQEVAAGDMANMGLSIDSFTLRDIQDEEGYLEALGRPRIAQVKRDAVIAEAEAKRDSDIRSAVANKDARDAEFGANTKIAEAQRNYETANAGYQATINQKKAEADLAYELQKNKTAQLVKAEEIEIEVVERDKRIQVQEKEIDRRKKELAANVNAPADAERYRIEALAQAERARLQAEAEGSAQAKRSIGQGEADAAKAKGLAEADVILAQGGSEAQAMTKKAEAWQQYNQAAVIQLVIEALPSLAREIAAPLAKTDKITVVSTGGDTASAGASRVTKDVAEVIAQLPPVLEALSGIDLNELIKNLPRLRQAGAAPAATKQEPGGPRAR